MHAVRARVATLVAASSICVACGGTAPPRPRSVDRPRLLDAATADQILAAMRREVLHGDRRVPHDVVGRLDRLVVRHSELFAEADAAQSICLDTVEHEIRVVIELLREPHDTLAVQALDGIEVVQRNVEACASADRELHAADVERSDGGRDPETAAAIAAIVVPLYAHSNRGAPTAAERLLTIARSDAPPGLRIRALRDGIDWLREGEPMEVISSFGPLCEQHGPGIARACDELRRHALVRAGDTAAALSYSERAYRHALDTFGPSDLQTLRRLRVHAGDLRRAGRADDARELLREALDRFPPVYEMSLAFHLHDLGQLLLESGDRIEAEQFFRGAHATAARAHGACSGHPADLLGPLVDLLSDQGRHDEALRLAQMRTRCMDPVAADEPGWVAMAYIGLARAHLVRAGFDPTHSVTGPLAVTAQPEATDPEEAIAACARAAELARPEARRASMVVEAGTMRGLALILLGRNAEARVALAEVIRHARAGGGNPLSVVAALMHDARAARAGGEPDLGLASLEAAFATAREGLAETRWVHAMLHHALFVTLTDLGRGAEAAAHIEPGLADMERSFGEGFGPRRELEAAREARP
jgi:tetratricopeptide (TPR) repeat protein